MALAIFDLDNTLLAGDSDHAWGSYLVQRRKVNADAYQQANDYFYQQYQSGGLDIHEYVAFVVGHINELSSVERDTLRREFLAEVIRPMIAPGTQALLDQHRARGDDLLIITATIDFITQPIAMELGITELLATIPEQSPDGEFNGLITGVPAFQEGKITRLRQWLDARQTAYDQQWFYSDSHNDLPLLQTVSHPVAVDPDATLRAAAEKQSWPIISLR